MPGHLPSLLLLCAALGATSMTAAALAAGDHAGGHGHGGESGLGAPGDPAEVARTIEVTLADIRFVLTNTGELVHEFNTGTAAMHHEHQAEMAAMMDHAASDMAGHAHDHPNSVLLEPGRSGELVWTFGSAADLEFACNVPGHYEAGMVGEIAFRH